MDPDDTARRRPDVAPVARVADRPDAHAPVAHPQVDPPAGPPPDPPAGSTRHDVRTHAWDLALAAVATTLLLA